MNNYSITTANRTTHVKIVAVALVAVVVLVVGGIAARPNLPDMSTQLEARAPALKAGKPVIWTSHEQTTIR